MTTDTVLVTGAFGLVGSQTVRQLLADGRRVVATDLDVPANRKAAALLPSDAVRWADLTDPGAVAELLRTVSPAAIIHLAAIIPPVCYARPALARRVNVDATRYLVDAAAALPGPASPTLAVTGLSGLAIGADQVLSGTAPSATGVH
ncbi:MAG: NAD-dependent epimerase/dehydratase family protein, partial [Mycobacterium sp.]|uniref:NAD-dependent epimerase/dehydratase family protein n=1 Tax=Mycobacterium sp. TaxID=1785 RepID=UPI003C381123